MRPWITTLAFCLATTPAAAQVQAPRPSPQPDAAAIRIGTTLFADYTIQQEPRARDVDGNAITPNAFNIGRAYLNVTGTVSNRVAFRVTPDVVRETGAGSSVAGSYVIRLKYAYGQFTLDDWMNRGSFVRFGMQPTPWIDFIDSVYRYRFQGPTFEDREGILSSSDVGATFRYVFGGNYGDVHTGFYNGDNYNRVEANDQKALMIRATVRPLAGHAGLGGIRLTGFYDHDAYVRSAQRRRAIGAVTYEHAQVNAGASYLATSDRQRAASPRVDGRGLSFWATPRTGSGWEALLRFDRLEPDVDLDGRKTRTIAGVAYWFPSAAPRAAALLLNVERVRYRDHVPGRPDERRLAMHMLVNF
ncbi:MAG: OprO/OprP family phosphate-selective porin [Acidobacteriota bacterium]|nr:OprO/OprP family phosphate-selective porin [Acidobacteriota bacterium]